MEDDDALRTACAAGRAAWPRAELSREALAAFTRRNQLDGDTLNARAADVYLAAACEGNDSAALNYFEQFFIAAIPRYVARLSLTREQLQEVQQRVRVRLFTGAQARIGTYAAKAPLDAWVRMVTIRVALDLLGVAGGPAAAPAANDAAEEAATSASEIEAFVIRRQMGPRLQQALSDGLQGLASRERSLLRMHFVDGLNIDEIGRVYGVHRATVARWLLSVRTQLFGTLKVSLSLQRAPSSSEFRSLVRVLRDDLHISLDRLRSRGL